jgi:hypothetical protein
MEALRSTEPGVTEYQLDAAARYVFALNDARLVVRQKGIVQEVPPFRRRHSPETAAAGEQLADLAQWSWR